MTQAPSYARRQKLRWDARDLMLPVEREQYGDYYFALRDRNGSVAAVTENELQASRTPMLLLKVNWPKTHNALARGILCVTNFDWDLCAHIIELTGQPKRYGGYIWRFKCPNTRKAVQTLYLDRDARQFVSRETVGYPRRPANGARILRHLSEISRLGEIAGGIDDNLIPIKKPKQMEEWFFEALTIEIDREFLRMHFAACNVPEPEFGPGDSVFIPAHSGRRTNVS